MGRAVDGDRRAAEDDTAGSSGPSDDAVRGAAMLAAGQGTLALTAVTVAGQCRERSPVDLALFGNDGERFETRFADPAEGRRLLAQAVEAGAASSETRVAAGAAVMPARVALWRQRGGDRIRLIAAFALAESGGEQLRADAVATTLAGVSRLLPGLEGAGAVDATALVAFARQIRRTLEATLLQLSETDATGRSLPERVAPSLWRLSTLVALMERHRDADCVPGAGAPLAETDLVALVRRVMTLHETAAITRDVGLVPPAPDTLGRHVAMVDQPSLWGAVEAAVDLGTRALGKGGTIAARIDQAAGLTLILVMLPGAEAAMDEGALVAEIEPLATAAGAPLSLSAETAKAGPVWHLALSIPPTRCLPRS
ncbi:MAG: hypothetical protein AAF899_07620 [Pseudomonadota bacterium]